MVADNHTLIKLLKLFFEVIGQYEYKKPHCRGRPSVYPDKIIMAVFLVMVVKKIHSFKGLHRYLGQNPKIRQACGLKSLPDRRTLGRRIKSLFFLYQKEN